MSQYENYQDDIPRGEPWLAVTASSALPVIAAFYVPSQYAMPLLIATVVLFLSGLMMLRRQTIRRQQDRPVAPSTHPEAEAS
jgi:hypothetical protein